MHSAQQAANEQWGGGGIVHSNGQPMRAPAAPIQAANTGASGGGPSGGDAMSEIAALKKNVNFLNWVAGAGVAALGTLYLLLSGQINDRYDRTADKLDVISNQISDVRVEVSEVKSNANTQRGD